MTDRFKINPTVLIGCPTLQRHPISWEFAEYFYAIRQPLGTSISRMRVEGKDVATARNEIAAEALRQNADYVLYVGDDVLVPPDIIERLRAHREAMVTGVYWTKSHPSAPYIWQGLQKGPCVDWTYGEYFPIDWAGCDALLISTEVFRTVPYPWFSLEWKFETEQPNCPLATEDIFFYTKARQAGYQLYVDTAVQCDHQDRTTLQRFGLTHEMPQYPGAKVRPADGLHVAELGAGHDTPHWNGAASVVRFDGNPDCKPDVRCDLRKIPWEDGQFDIAHCFPAGELILTPQGFSPVESMQVGGTVVSHTGERRSVLHTFTRDYIGAARQVVPSGYAIGFRVTPGHPFYGYRASDLGSYARIGWKQRLGKMQRLGPPEWIPSHELERGDVLVCPIPSHTAIPEPFDFARHLRSDELEAYETVTALPVPVSRGAGGSAALKDVARDLGIPFTMARGWRYHGKRPFGFYADDDTITWHGASKESTVKRHVVIGPDLLRLIGYWLADGWVHRDQLGFIFGEHETAYVDDVVQLVRDIFGVEPIQDAPDGTHTIRVRYANRAFIAAWSVVTERVKGAHGKRIPSWAYWLPPDWQRELLTGFLRGDGSVSTDGRRETLATVSRQLAEELRFLYLRCGIAAGIAVSDQPVSTVNGRDVVGAALYRVSATADRHNDKGTHIKDGVLYSRVRDVRDIWLAETVYNCQVETDESYLTPYAASHNSRHVLEHFAPFEAPDLIKEWARIVRPGGKLIVNVPNLAYAAKEILRADADPTVDVTWYPHWQVFGRQTGHENEVHRNGFSRHGLKRLFESVGLTDVVVTVHGDSGENLEAVAIVPEREPPLAIGPAWRAIEQAEMPPTNGHGYALTPCLCSDAETEEPTPEPAEAVTVQEG